MSAAARTAPAADGPFNQTPANRDTNTLVPGSFPQEIGPATGGLAALSGSRLTRVSSLALVGALDAAIAHEGAGSFPVRKCPNCVAPLVQKPGEQDHDFVQRLYCHKSCKTAHSNYRASQARLALKGTASWNGSGFPRPVDAGREPELYGTEAYDSPGRINLRAVADRGSPGLQASLMPNFPRSKDAS